MEKVTNERIRLRSETIQDLLDEYNTNPECDQSTKNDDNETTCPCFHLRKWFGCAHVDIHTAILDGYDVTIRKTIQRIQRIQKQNPNHINQLDKQGRSALSLATKLNHETSVMMLLSIPYIDVNIQDQITGMSPLHHAAYTGSIPIMQALIQKGGIIDSVDKYGRCPLMIACAKGRKDMVCKLLNEDADPEQKDSYLGWNSLFYAADAGHLDIVQILLDEGVDKDIKDKKNIRAMDWAKMKNYDDTVSYLERYHFVPKVKKRISWVGHGFNT